MNTSTIQIKDNTESLIATYSPHSGELSARDKVFKNTAPSDEFIVSSIRSPTCRHLFDFSIDGFHHCIQCIDSIYLLLQGARNQVNKFLTQLAYVLWVLLMQPLHTSVPLFSATTHWSPSN